MSRVAIGLGSNLGDRFDHVTTAFEELEAIGRVVTTSSLYETEPVGGPDQGDYLNAVAIIETDMAPRQVLDGLLAIEQRHGRHRRERWGPRTLDLDLLVYEGATVDEDGLTVPHRHIAERRFVLEPLSEVWPDAAIGGGLTARKAMEHVLDQQVSKVMREESSAAEIVDVAGWQVFAVTMGLALAFWWLVDWLL